MCVDLIRMSDKRFRSPANLRLKSLSVLSIFDTILAVPCVLVDGVVVNGIFEFAYPIDQFDFMCCHLHYRVWLSASVTVLLDG